jgi:hypothetical protein
MLIDANVSAFIGEHVQRTGPLWSNYKHVSYNYLSEIKPEDTVVLIFSLGQEKELDILMKDPSIKILFKGDKAINGNYPREGPRNTIVIIEKADATETQPVSEVP